jgi:hypothetical protein
MDFFLGPPIVTQKGYLVANRRGSGRPSTRSIAGGAAFAPVVVEAPGAGWNGQLGGLSAKARRMTTR